MQLLRTADFFGVPFIQQIDSKQSIYKSALGGLVTLLICSASLAYAIWVLYLWQNNKLSPKISSSIYVSDFSLLDLDYDVIKMYYWKIEENYIDPFESKILLPLVMYTTNFSFTELQVINKSNETATDGTQFYLPKISLAFQNISGVIYTSSEMYIQIVKCQQIYLKEDEKCASDELIEQFFSQPLNTIVLQVQQKQLNSLDGSVQDSLQEFYIQIEKQNCYTLSTFLQSNFYELQNSFLFGYPTQLEFINGALIQSQTNSVEFCKLAYGNDILGVIFIAMKGNQIKTIFEYPHAGDLLANIGSIVSVLFMIKHVIIIFNQYNLNNKIIKKLIQFYYPDFKNIIIYKNWRFKTTKVFLNHQELDLKEFKLFHKKVKQQMENKLSYLNLLYEMSRVYFIIRSFKQREELKKSHQIGIKLNLAQSKIIVDSNQNCDWTNRLSATVSHLNDEDADLLSLSHTFKQHIELQIPNEIYIENEFYENNKIS
ncbi:unnamed protein product (macronuclear) [Paramecium tetraurelia]|uniref:Transmembrane protein n=1 Tax=Paramecium tetraurelia TaxID=5888 RepID=A0D2M0_PARTE|nr:uncharacterized protein GSPATT00012795001 [Paramecium tetraurelia]CAK77287.1 unnamed protein product [Paramecium tetraurelia]|eukprot:XP_001444684.1 hypothetical protein (macronuclear) [Paramecium tetraurelia strain d4-2]